MCQTVTIGFYTLKTNREYNGQVIEKNEEVILCPACQKLFTFIRNGH